jgi:hypothetical protein
MRFNRRNTTILGTDPFIGTDPFRAPLFRRVLASEEE